MTQKTMWIQYLRNYCI